MNFVKNSRPPGFDSLQQKIDAYGYIYLFKITKSILNYECRPTLTVHHDLEVKYKMEAIDEFVPNLITIESRKRVNESQKLNTFQICPQFAGKQT